MFWGIQIGQLDFKKFVTPFEKAGIMTQVELDAIKATRKDWRMEKFIKLLQQKR